MLNSDIIIALLCIQQWLRQGPPKGEDITATAQPTGKVSAGLASPSFQPIIKPPNPTHSDIRGEVRVEDMVIEDGHSNGKSGGDKAGALESAANSNGLVITDLNDAAWRIMVKRWRPVGSRKRLTTMMWS